MVNEDLQPHIIGVRCLFAFSTLVITVPPSLNADAFQTFQIFINESTIYLISSKKVSEIKTEIMSYRTREQVYSRKSFH